MNIDFDEKLVALYLSGDETALQSLVRTHMTGVYNFVAQFVGYGRDAEDVAQETFIKAWKNLKRFNTAKKFKPWLFRIARNSAIDFLRQRKLTVSLINTYDGEETDEADNLADPAPLPLAQVMSSEMKKSIQDAINSLPQIYSTVLKLYYLEEFSLPEIAKILSEPVDTVKSRHRRALIKLRRLVSEGKSRIEP